MDLSFSGPSKIPSANIARKMGSSAWGNFTGSDAYHASSDATLFSSSLPVFPHEKININDTNGCQSIDDVSSSFNELQLEMKGDNSLEDETHAIGSLLPDDEDELLAGLTDGYDLTGLARQEELEDYDLFGNVGGLELENDTQESLNIITPKISVPDGVVENGMAQFNLPNGIGSVAGEHPYGEHPSRTLFVRNINSNVEDSELRTLFEQYGDIRTLYTTCKHRGFVMISYYDIRSARYAMRALQNKPLRRRKLDIHFSIPKDNPSDKDINQGTLVVFNLDPSVSNDDLFQIFGAYGEVKEIRETPNKRHHKFIEFFDVRAAEAALKALNKSDIAGKRIKLEPSRPGGARRNLMLQLNQDLEPDEPRNLYHQVGSPITNSPPVTGNWMQKNSPIENSPLQNLSTSPSFATMNSLAGNPMSGLASILHPQASNGAPIHKDQVRIGHVEHLFNHQIGFPNSHSLLESKLSQFSGNFSSGSSASNCSGIETLSRSQFLWGSPKLNAEHTNASLWSMPSLGPAYTSNAQKHGFPYPGRNGSFSSSPHYHLHHHVGSAPSGVPIERQLGFFQESSDTSLMNPVAFGNISLGHNEGILRKKVGAPHAMNSGIATLGNMPDKGSSMLSSPRLSPLYLGSGLYSGMATHMEGLVDRGRSRRFENSTGQVDNKKQFLLDLEKIKNGEDIRTTLMIKNIPNKYTSKMLLAAIDESNRGTYDFIYLPIDFKNKCNVGYAFINMLSHSLIIPFYQAFNGKKWEKFNSEKVASLAYARIQGKAALVTHFQNSSLMNEDKRCRPILFHPEGSEADDQLNGLRLGGSAETQ